MQKNMRVLSSFLIYTSLLFSVSCSASNGIQPESKTGTHQASTVVEDSELVTVVREFMLAVTDGSKEQASKYLSTEASSSSSNLGLNSEVPRKLDWYDYFREREFQLAKVIGTETKDGSSTVDVLLTVGGDGDPIQIGATFKLLQVDGKWLIEDVDLRTRKSSVQI